MYQIRKLSEENSLIKPAEEYYFIIRMAIHFTLLKLQKCVDFTWNFVHSSEPHNRYCVITYKMLKHIQPNFMVYLISMKDMQWIPFENFIWIFFCLHLIKQSTSK